MKHIINYFNDQGHLTEEALALYVDLLRAKKTEVLVEPIRKHVEECTECKSEIVELYDLTSVHLKRVHEPEMPYRAGKVALLYRIAAVILVCIGIGGVLMLNKFYTGNDIPATPDIAQQPAEPMQREKEQGVQNNLISAAYEPSPVLEGMVDNPTRSVMVHLLSPRTGENVDSTILFSWSSGAHGPFVITVLTNKSERIVRTTVAGKKYQYRHRLPAGLYYWKLEDSTDLLGVGKFFVRLGK